MKPKPHDCLRVRELEAERLLIREPRRGRVRVILETAPPRAGMELPELPSARFTLLDGRGQPRLVAEVDAAGDARLFVGGPDAGPMVVIAPQSVDLWSTRSVRASLRTEGAQGIVEVDRPPRRPSSRRKK